MTNTRTSGKSPVRGGKRPENGGKQSFRTPARRDGYVTKIVPKTVTRTRADIALWKSALRAADNVENPRRTRLQRLYADIMQDAHLTSLVELRVLSLLGTPFTLKRNGEVDEECTALLASAAWKRDIDRFAWEELLYGHSLIELTTSPDGTPQVTLLPRTNVVPEQGVLLLSEDDGDGIRYREAREYGTWILEFGSRTEYGLLNKAVPHVLFSRFAQSCWSELCEIYAIPPRVLKTNTQDPEMLDRAEQMMREMGAAAWFIIDTNEEFSFAKGADTNGDVYNNLIRVCKEASSLLICGAQLGQDTLNGNRSKEESSQKLFDKIIQADRTRVQGYWNEIILPALVRIGIVPAGLTYEYQQEEDLEKLWQQTHQAMQYFHVEPEWIRTKFGIEVTGEKETGALSVPLAARDGFFV
jgi:phage gp29-like protein